jgi:hypothetical protein
VLLLYFLRRLFAAVVFHLSWFETLVCIVLLQRVPPHSIVGVAAPRVVSLSIGDAAVGIKELKPRTDAASNSNNIMHARLSLILRDFTKSIVTEDDLRGSP